MAESRRRPLSLGRIVLFVAVLVYVYAATHWWLFTLHSAINNRNVVILYLGRLWELVIIFPITIVLALMGVSLRSATLTLIACTVVASSTWIMVQANTWAYHQSRFLIEDLQLSVILGIVFTLVQLASKRAAYAAKRSPA